MGLIHLTCMPKSGGFCICIQGSKYCHFHNKAPLWCPSQGPQHRNDEELLEQIQSAGKLLLRRKVEGDGRLQGDLSVDFKHLKRAYK